MKHTAETMKRKEKKTRRSPYFGSIGRNCQPALRGCFLALLNLYELIVFFDGWENKCLKPLTQKSADSQSWKNDHVHLTLSQILILQVFL